MRCYRLLDVKKGETLWVEQLLLQEIVETKEAEANFFFSSQGKLRQLAKTLFGDKASLHFLFQGQVYVDPNKPNRAWKLNEEGQITYSFTLKSSRQGLFIRDVVAYPIDQEKGIEPFQIIDARFLQHPVIEALSAIEEKENMLIKKNNKGEFLAIVLPRYDVSFSLKGDKIVCTTAPFVGYSLDPSASVKEKGGLSRGLLLIPEDKKQPRKMIVPSSLTATWKKQTVFARAGIFCKRDFLAASFMEVKK